MLQVSHAMPAMFVGQYRDGGSEVDQILPWPQERYLHWYVPRHMLFLPQAFDSQIGDIVMAVLIFADIRDLGFSANPSPAGRALE